MFDLVVVKQMSVVDVEFVAFVLDGKFRIFFQQLFVFDCLLCGDVGQLFVGLIDVYDDTEDDGCGTRTDGNPNFYVLIHYEKYN